MSLVVTMEDDLPNQPGIGGLKKLCCCSPAYVVGDTVRRVLQERNYGAGRVWSNCVVVYQLMPWGTLCGGYCRSKTMEPAELGAVVLLFTSLCRGEHCAEGTAGAKLWSRPSWEQLGAVVIFLDIKFGTWVLPNFKCATAVLII